VDRGSWMMLSLEFRLSSNVLPRAVLRLQLSDLPFALWSRSALEATVAKVGSLARLDDSTEMLNKGMYARIAVDVDLSVSLVPGTQVTGEDFVFPLLASFRI